VTSGHSTDLDGLLATTAELDTGLIKINAPTSGVDFYASFEGEKESSFGPREQGQDALAFYISVRAVTMGPHGG
jgi:acyl-CoA reductase-like NAD-dependent aldehyde dehydrogenase